jgi:chaperonin GroEL (HSP60 family)
VIAANGEKARTMLHCDRGQTQFERDYAYRSGWRKLAGGIAVIRVGGSTEVEVKERKDHR